LQGYNKQVKGTQWREEPIYKRVAALGDGALEAISRLVDGKGTRKVLQERSWKRRIKKKTGPVVQWIE
jgi:hypothetical protein